MNAILLNSAYELAFVPFCLALLIVRSLFWCCHYRFTC